MRKYILLLGLLTGCIEAKELNNDFLDDTSSDIIIGEQRPVATDLPSRNLEAGSSSSWIRIMTPNKQICYAIAGGTAVVSYNNCTIQIYVGANCNWTGTECNCHGNGNGSGRPEVIEVQTGSDCTGIPLGGPPWEW